MTEQWKWIVYQGHDFTGKYQVSNLGRIKGVERMDGSNHIQHERILLQRENSRKGRYQKTRYKTVTLWDNGKQVDAEVHRLVATMFLPKEEGQTCVNHKDGNGRNNSVDNLEWCTARENAIHSVETLGNNPRKWKCKPVAQKTTDGKVVRIWESAWDIQRELGFCQVSISRCCRRQKKSGIIYGFLWDFAEGRDQKHDDQTGSGEFSGKEAV